MRVRLFLVRLALLLLFLATIELERRQDSDGKVILLGHDWRMERAG